MILRNGKQTLEIDRMLESRTRTRTRGSTHLEYNITAAELERVLIADGHQTYKNLRDLKKMFSKTEDQYLKMLKGIARGYGYRHKL